eukprot:CAMPEP_0194706036 /NCGR_PEP_ID=MMETSP0295-20121207/29320_1 /TAXON_ID=39354 /ORGANISM="Heterosigma akashiwo, Strain CCMP2393" /LENGTH=336 /DNA_ID=CAMNT_0039601897 /DNA_START=163 /DNA_END=1171 /DNA_ORIENTATION=-
MSSSSLNVLKTKHIRTLEILQTLQRENQKLRKENEECKSILKDSYTQEQVDIFVDEAVRKAEEKSQTREKELLVKLEKLKQKYDEAVEKHSDIVEDLKNQINVQMEELDRLKEFGDERRQSIGQMEIMLVNAQRENKELHEKNAKLGNEMASMSKLSTESEEKITELQAMVDKLNKNTTEINELVEQLERQEAINLRMKQELEKREEKLKKMKNSNMGDTKEMKKLLEAEKTRTRHLETVVDSLRQSSEKDVESLRKLKEAAGALRAAWVGRRPAGRPRGPRGPAGDGAGPVAAGTGGPGAAAAGSGAPAEGGGGGGGRGRRRPVAVRGVRRPEDR